MICQACEKEYKEDEGTPMFCDVCAEEAYQNYIEELQQRHDEDAENFIQRY